MSLIVNPGSGGNTNFTDGSIPYSSSGILTENNANLRWDNATTTLYVNGVAFTPGKYSASTGASFVGFAQSGAGALTGNVSAQLQKFGFLSDFDTAGNYQTFRDALTGTMATPNLYVNGTLAVTGASTLTGALAANGGITATTYTGTGQMKHGNGSAAAPAYSFSNASNVGLYWNGATAMAFVTAGVDRLFLDSTTFYLSGVNLSLNVSGTAILTTDGTDIVSQKRANNAQEYRVYAGNGGFISNVKTATESLTIAAAATTVGVTSIPAGAILLGVSVRVTTVIPTAATFTYATTVGATALSTAAVSTAANSTDPGTAAGASFRAAATTITITPNLTPGAATGVVRLHYYYLQITPPTS